MARLALIEGDASLLMTQWLTSHLDTAGIAEILAGDPAAQAQLDAAPPFIRDGLLFPYMQGVGVSRLMNDAGGTSNNAGPAYVGSVLSRVPVVLIENDPAMVSGNLSGQDQVADAIARGVGAYFQGR